MRARARRAVQVQPDPTNLFPGSGFGEPAWRILAFQRRLMDAGIVTTIRRDAATTSTPRAASLPVA